VIPPAPTWLLDFHRKCPPSLLTGGRSSQSNGLIYRWVRRGLTKIFPTSPDCCDWPHCCRNELRSRRLFRSWHQPLAEPRFRKQERADGKSTGFVWLRRHKKCRPRNHPDWRQQVSERDASGNRQDQCRWQECRLDLRYARHRAISALQDRIWSRRHYTSANRWLRFG
jgi:hypothetical protein